MARLLALEWDGREARVAVARTRGTEAIVEHAFSVDLASREAGDSPAEANVGQRVAAALAARRIGRCDTLVGVGRASIELRRLSLPPAPPEDLPDMVRFQAMREFAGVGEDWPLDFVPLEGAPAENSEPGGAVGVLAAVIAPKLVEQIRQTCEAAGLEPTRIVLRPFAAASLVRRARPSGECRLLIDLVTEEADLTVLIGENVVFVRTVRLPNDEDAQIRALLGEARRTIAAAHNQLGGRRVERLVVCGETSRVQAVETLVQEQLSLPVEAFDPFSAVEVDGDLKAGLPDRPGRFAPLLGMLQDEAAQVRHDIDFLNPRRRPLPPSQRRRNVLIAATAATAVLACVFAFWYARHSADAEIKDLQAKSKKLDKTLTAYRKLQAKAEDIDQFVRGDVAWLDQLKKVSETLPSGEKILVNRVRINALPAGGGQVLMDGNAKDASDYTAMIHAVKNATGKGVSQTQQDAKYPWRWDNVTVHVVPPEEEEAAVARPPAKAPAAKAPAKKAGG